jgi:DNA-binding transcriptional LysR family regulator
MELRQLRYFIGVAEMQSFTRASESFFVSQSTLSQQISKLEAELGTKLFERSTREVKLTTTGEAVLEVSRHILRGVDGLESLAKNDVSCVPELRREIRIGFDARMMYAQGILYTITDAIYEMRSLSKNLHVSFTVLRFETLLDELLEGHVYLAFFLHQQESKKMNEDLETQSLGDDRLVIAVRPASNETACDLDSARSILEHYGVVLLDGESHGAWQAMKIFQTLGIEPHIHFASSRESMLLLLQSGEYATVVPQGVINKQSRENMRFIPLDVPEAVLHCFAAWTRGSYDSIIKGVLGRLLDHQSELFPHSNDVVS